MKKSLVIVQDVPTQFDVPLYNKIADEKPFALTVIYTQVVSEDIETGQTAQWDHIKEHRYQHYYLNNIERNSRDLVADKVIDAEPDHVVVSGYWPALHRDLMRSLKQHGVSVGLRSDNTIRHSKLGGIRGLAKRIYLKRLLARYDVWHPVGRQAADYLRYLSSESRPICLFPYNVDNVWFSQNAKRSRVKRPASLTELGFPKDSYIILGVMKWSEREDPMTLLRAFEKYHSYNSNARLILVGDGPLKMQVNELAQKLGDLVHTPGYSSYSRLPFWYGLADVFVHPAPNEPWGVSVSEALASGVPVIASTGVGAAIEQLTDGENGYIFEQGKVSSLLDALKKWQVICASKPSSEVEQSCQFALRDWNYETTIQHFRTVLQDD